MWFFWILAIILGIAALVGRATIDSNGKWGFITAYVLFELLVCAIFIPIIWFCWLVVGFSLALLPAIPFAILSIWLLNNICDLLKQ